ncbi:hypothetical protein NGF19_22715 [Streptomyces sp. RY43-2]|uniref:Uncharacterized protein n=1 Tax=Streptomyces macrolidinus TaxID=2952607 RepID=A0ABT0ZJ11_9ACTN|nr:hypothetical protein [Streptomyces macrolidinus]MCN9243565.1 hypothetical protein [Streptomyces macrolidinus]
MTATGNTIATGNGNGDENERAARPGCVITADGSYAARLALNGESWYPERWTLGGPEPYAVPLPGHQPEEPGRTEVQPLADGRVLIHRVTDGRHTFSLLYPTGPGTGELALGTVECAGEESLLRLLPPAPTGDRAYALAVAGDTTTVWLLTGGEHGPAPVARVPARCSGGVWLDRTGRLLALDRTPRGGPTKSVVVDLARGGEVSPLLEITEESEDRLLLADPDSGLVLIRSDAPSPGRARLGWGVLGSTLPVRFPECLRLDSCSVTPFAIQPGQTLTPESCAVALRIDGTAGHWVGVWRPSERRVQHFPPPRGWLAGAGLWTREGELRLPFATDTVRCGIARLAVPPRAAVPAPATTSASASTSASTVAEEAAERSDADSAVRPVPLQQAPLLGRTTSGTARVRVRRPLKDPADTSAPPMCAPHMGAPHMSAPHTPSEHTPPAPPPAPPPVDTAKTSPADLVKHAPIPNAPVMAAR